ncbi:hypothetical protein BAZMOX_48536_1 [methanotrophic endosymbiont of Bathymodiolus azoricus (Menez Gwen)]|nr:hypothetical protein BAZMOX_48536_1 [methanotrophic endosymbiont of Bathymodiolus azoricus (Menez Gwen)]
MKKAGDLAARLELLNKKAVKRGRKAYVNHTIVSVDDIHIEYTG